MKKYLILLMSCFLWLQAGDRFVDLPGDRTLPQGDWAYSSRPLFLVEQPVNVISVATNRERGLALEYLHLTAIPEDVIGVRIRMILTIDEMNGTQAIWEKKSGIIPVERISRSHLNMGRMQSDSMQKDNKVRMDFFSFSDVYQHFTAKGTNQLNGVFHLYVMVSDIYYENGDVIEMDSFKQIDDILEFNKQHFKYIDPECPMAECVYYGNYWCESAADYTCQISGPYCETWFCR